MDAETRCLVTQSIPASESQRRNSLENQDRKVLQESFASFHGAVHDKSSDCSSRFAEEIGCAMDERNLVGRLDESDGHVVLTPHGTVTGRSVQRLAGNLRVQPDLVEKVKSRVQDPALSQAELLRVLPASVPIRLSGETDTDQLAEEQDRAAQNEQMEGIVEEGTRAEITRPLRSLEEDNDEEVKRRRLGEPLATIPETSDEVMEDPVPIVHEDWKRERSTNSFPREPVELSSSSSGPQRMKLSCLRVSNVSAVQKPSTRTEESIAKSRAEHIKHLLEIGAVKDWNREDAIKTGAKILSGKMKW